MPGHLSAAEAPEDLWTCHDCGWTYPNHHPSAKHRRNHKKVCGSIPGFIGTISTRKAAPEPMSSIIDGASSDDASSDDEITPDKTHKKRGHHHTTQKVAPAHQTVAASGGSRAAKSQCVTHRSKDLCLHGEEANMKPAPLTERTFSDQNNRKALQSTGSTPNAPVKSQHVRRRSAHALEGVWVCRHCGWTYPNAHPSAKHRRKHKKKCPALGVTPRHVVGAGGSSDDASSDEDNKRGDASPDMQEAPAMNISSTISSLTTGLEAFLGRSDSKRELREIQDTIILLSPKPVSRRNSFKSPRHRREGPSGFLSPRGAMKSSKVVNQAQESVTGTEKMPEAVSDQENEDPVVLNLPAVRIVTPRPVPAPENVVGETSLEGRRSLSDESDLNNSDGETPSSPDSVLQPVHLLLPSTTSTNSEETRTSHQEETGEEVLHQEAAALKLDLETEKDEFTTKVAVKQDQHDPAPELRPPFICEASPEVDTPESHPAAAADQKGPLEVSCVNSCEPVDASPCTELQTAVTRTISEAKETEVRTGADVDVIFSGWKYVASSLVVKTAVETAVKAHVELSALDSDTAPEHVTNVVGECSDEGPVDRQHHDVQDKNKCHILSENESVSIPAREKLTDSQSCKELDSSEIVTTHNVVADGTKALDNDFSSQETRADMSSATRSEEDDGKAGDSKLKCAKALRKAELEEASEKGGSDAAEEDPDVLQSSVEASFEVVKEEGKDAETLSSGVLSSNQLPKEIIVTEEDRDSKTSSFESLSPDQLVEVTVEAVKEKEDRDLPLLTSEVPSADQLSLECTGEAVKEDINLQSLSSEGLSFDEPSEEVTVKEEDKDLPLITSKVSSIDQSPVDCSSDVVDKNLPIFSSEGSAAEHLSVDESGEVLADKEEELPASRTEGLAPFESPLKSNSQSTTLLSEVQVKINILPDSLNAAGVQPTSSDTLELSFEPTSLVTLVTTPTQSATVQTDAVPEDDLSSERSANEKVEESIDMEPALDEIPSTTMGPSDLNSETLPTSKSQVVVTGPVGDKISDQSESQTTDVVEEKTTSSAAIDSHLSVGRLELPEGLHHSGAAEEECMEVHGSDEAEESKDNVPDAADNSRNTGVIASKGADDFTAEQQVNSNPGATSTLDSACSVIGDQVTIDELKSDLSKVPSMQQQKGPPRLAEVWEMNISDQVRELSEKVTTEERTEVVEVVEPCTIKSDYVVDQAIEKKVDDLEKEVQVVSETKESQGYVEETIGQKVIGEASSKSSLDDVPANRSSLSESSDSSVATSEETGAAGSGPEEKQEEVAVCEKESATVTISQVPEVAEKEKASVKQVGLFGQYKEKFNKLQREPGLKAREPRPTMIRLPGSGKRKLLPSICGTPDDSPVVKNKKQESRPGKDRDRGARSDTEVPFKLTFTCRPAKRTPAESPLSSPQRPGGPGSPEGIVKERIETYERLIGKTRTFGPVPAPSPTYNKFSFSAGKPSSPHVSGLTVITSNQLFEHEHAVSTEEQISAIAAHLHHVEPKDATKSQDTGNAPEELRHEALSQLRHNKNNEQDTSSTEPEDSPSQRISKVPLVLRETGEHCLSPVPRVTKAY